jgi:hypothetical protein
MCVSAKNGAISFSWGGRVERLQVNRKARLPSCYTLELASCTPASRRQSATMPFQKSYSENVGHKVSSESHFYHHAH